MSELKTGDKAPAFELNSADGSKIGLSDFAGQAVILYAYPAAMTPGCTTQACDFRDSIGAWQAAGFAVLGISPDTPAKLAEFVDVESLPFPLLSDPDHKVLESYGAWGEKVSYGKPSIGVIRSTFVIDVDAAGKGSVRHAWYRVKATGHVDKLRRDLGLDK